MNLRRDALQIFRAALDAADAGNAVRRHLAREGSSLRVGDHRFELTSYQRIRLIAVGKAAASMAQAVAEVLKEKLSAAIVVTKHGHSALLPSEWTYLEAGHPVPDDNGLLAAERIRFFSRDCAKDDLLLVAISGGASALLPAPAEGLTLGDKQATTTLLLRAGADIYELNTVRKHLSFLKAGRLAQLAYPATVVGLMLSDVIGDRLDVIGSGLTAPDPSTFRDALDVIDKYHLQDALPRTVLSHLQRAEVETPKADDPVFARVRNVIVGSNGLALQAAMTEARMLGYPTLTMDAAAEGEARTVAQSFVARGLAQTRPLCLLAGGETTVQVRGHGKGGRNQEFALAAAIALDGRKNVAVLSGGTDGTDGPTDAAGAIATGETISRARALGLDAREFLQENNSYPFFDALGDLVRTGPTGTNVMDVHILLALEEAQ